MKTPMNLEISCDEIFSKTTSKALSLKTLDNLTMLSTANATNHQMRQDVNYEL
jgi:hypothetical protein